MPWYLTNLPVNRLHLLVQREPARARHPAVALLPPPPQRVHLGPKMERRIWRLGQKSLRVSQWRSHCSSDGLLIFRVQHLMGGGTRFGLYAFHYEIWTSVGTSMIVYLAFFYLNAICLYPGSRMYKSASLYFARDKKKTLCCPIAKRNSCTDMKTRSIRMVQDDPAASTRAFELRCGHVCAD